MIERWLEALPGWAAAAVLVGILVLATIIFPALIEMAPWEAWF